jgi:hypothetical protein
MTPQERQMLQGLFDRLREASSQQREAEAERFIADQVRNQPYAPYYMAQAVLVQEQALEGAQQRIAELEARVQELEAGAGQRPAASSGSFLGGLWGGSRNQAPAPAARPMASVPQTGRAGPWTGGQGGGYAQQPAPMAQSGGGGGFLKGALATAAGVAGGAFLYDQLKGAFGSGSQTAANSGLDTGGVGPIDTAQGNEHPGGGEGMMDAEYSGDDGGFDGGDIEI